jgi:autocrine motility factor receptor
MGASYLAISAVCTVLSFSVLTEVSLDILRSDGLIVENLTNFENANHALELLFGSYATIALVVNFVFNVFILLNLCLKVSFFFFNFARCFLVYNCLFMNIYVQRFM